MALVHSPYWPTPDDHPANKDKSKNSKQHWQSNVEYTDKIVGKLIDALDEMGERDNTMNDFGVLFDCGDSRNGEGYVDVTNSDSAEVQHATLMMLAIVHDKPVPVVQPKERKKK